MHKRNQKIGVFIIVTVVFLIMPTIFSTNTMMGGIPLSSITTFVSIGIIMFIVKQFQTTKRENSDRTDSEYAQNSNPIHAKTTKINHQCEYCGYENEPGREYCENCGARQLDN